MEVLVEDDVVFPGIVLLEPLDPAEARPPAVSADEEERHQPLAEVGGDLLERVLVLRAGRVLELEVVAEEPRVAAECLDDEEVDGHPDRAPPVRVAAEHPGRRLGRLVIDRRVHARNVEDERLLGVDARDGPETVIGEELLLVEEPREEPQHPSDADDAEQQAPVVGPAARRMRGPEHVGRALVDRLGPVDDLLVDRGDPEERQHPDDRANADRHLACRQAGAAGRRRSRRPRPRGPAIRASRVISAKCSRNFRTRSVAGRPRLFRIDAIAAIVRA